MMSSKFLCLHVYVIRLVYSHVTVTTVGWLKHCYFSVFLSDADGACPWVDYTSVNFDTFEGHHARLTTLK